MMLNDRRRRPTHPGELIREDILPNLKLTQGEFADLLDVSRRTVVELVSERRAVSPDMAHRLAQVLNTTPELWMNMQQAVDLWESLMRHESEYKMLRRADLALV